MLNPRLLIAGLALGALMTVTTVAQAQDEAMKANKAKKLAGEWLKNAAWELDYDAALKKAREGNQLIFGYFTRSYAP